MWYVYSNVKRMEFNALFPYLFIFITGGQPKDNPPFFCRVFLDLAQYFHSASSRKCRQMSPREVTFSLDEREVTWLCFHAFQSCLRKKQSRYGELLKFLRKGLSQLRLPAEDFKAVIETDTPQHAVFKLIRWQHMQASCSIGTLSSCPKVHQIRYWPQMCSPKCWWQEGAKNLSSSLLMQVGFNDCQCVAKITQWRIYYMRNSRSSPLLNKLSEIFFMLSILDLSDVSRGVVLNFFRKKIIILLESLNLVCMCGFNFLFSTFLLISYSEEKKNH